MAGGGAGEKTEKATPKRKKDERKKGNIFSSKDLVSAFFIIIMFFSIKILGKFFLSTFYSSMTYWIGLCDGSFKLNSDSIRPMIVEIIKTVTFIAGPMLIISIFINILFTGAQTRFIFSMEAIKPKFSRINPIEGFKRLFSLRSIIEVIKSLIKIAVVGAVIYDSIKKNLVHYAKLFDVDIKTAVLFICSSIFSVAMTIGAIFIVLGIFDFIYQWWDYEKNLRMSKQEIKEEYKQMEGDPLIKSQIKQRQREMAQKRMMAEVPKSDVIIRNPTHYAIAILYDPKKSGAPIVVAKGKDYVAQKIIDIAKENDILMTENVPLAHALYDEVDLGREIPPAFYQEVAEILAWVYDLKHKTIPESTSPY